uniref:Uncharacterized protein n=1 Tax=Mycobacterium sp. (strain KMS) TaxID=189918 RepID=A1UB54_MYCSK
MQRPPRFAPTAADCAECNSVAGGIRSSQSTSAVGRSVGQASWRRHLLIGPYSRTPTVGALYDARLKGVGVAGAPTDIRTVLPRAHPNRAFRAALRRLHARQPRQWADSSPTRPAHNPHGASVEW